MNKRIWLSLAHMGGREQDFIKEAFDTNWVVPLGPNVDAFEQSLAEYLHEDRRVVALSAGTAALHLGLILLDVKPGDEVICQSFTFAASANPISYLEAKPVFVDSEKDTWNMDPVLLEEAIKDRLRKTGKLPKAIIPVHLYGMPAKMDEIMEIAGRYGIPVLEDARIEELSFGSWEGLGCRKANFEIPSEHFQDFYKDPFHFQTAADGETIEQLCVRTKAFWDDLVNNPDWQDKTILIASHGCACRGILHDVYEDKTDFWHGKVPPNCAVNIVSAEDGKAVLEAEDKIYYDPAECVDFRTGKKASQTGKAAQTR